MTKRVTSRFVLQGDNQLTSAFAKARTQMNNLAKRAALFGTAMAAGVAVAVRKQSQYIDELAKTSDFVGVAVESLQGLRFAAELTGVATQGLDDSLRRLNRRAGEFANSGGGPAAKAFETLGISIRDAGGQVKPTERLFDDIVEAMQRVETDGQRAALAAQLFGDDFGPKLVPLLNQGIDGINEARRTFEALHGTLSDTDAAGVVRMNDALTTAQLVGQGLARQYTAALAPAIAAIAEQFTEAAKEAGGFKERAQSAAESTVDGIAFIANAIEGVRRTFEVWGRTLAVTFATMELGALQFANSIINGPGAAMDYLIRQANRIPGIDVDFQFGPAAPQIQERMALVTQIVREGVGDIHEILMQPLPGDALIAGFERVRSELEKTVTRRDSDDAPFGIDAEAISDEANRAQQIFQQTRTDFERYAEQLNEAFALFKAGFLDEDTFRRYVDQLEQIFEHTEDIAGDHFDQIAIIQEQALRRMEGHLADYLFDPFENGVKGMVRGFIDALRKMAAEAAAARIMDKVFSAEDGVLGFIGGLLKFGGGKALGGPVQGGTAYMVGERGPEMFVPQSSGKIVPNHALGGGINITTNIDARNSDDPARLLALVPVISNSIKADIAQSLRRGRPIA